MQKYQLNVTLDRHDNRQNKKVNSKDISQKNRQLLYHFYKNDFVYLFPNNKSTVPPPPTIFNRKQKVKPTITKKK